MLRLRAELSDQQADAYVVRLWAWSQVYAPSGRFEVELSYALEAELLWTGAPGSLAAAFVKCGWLDRVGEALAVHDWADFQEFYVKKSRKDADKKRKRRSRMSASCPQPVRMDGAAPSARTAPPTDGRDGRTDGRDNKEEAAREKPRAGSKEKNSTDPRHAPLVKALVDASPGYAFLPRDAKAVQELLKLGEPPEIVARWRAALASSGFPSVRSIFELPPHWNRFGGTVASTGPAKAIHPAMERL